jgi:hypothetical protein
MASSSCGPNQVFSKGLC